MIASESLVEASGGRDYYWESELLYLFDCSLAVGKVAVFLVGVVKVAVLEVVDIKVALLLVVFKDTCFLEDVNVKVACFLEDFDGKVAVHKV